jgi:hypothetical protein
MIITIGTLKRMLHENTERVEVWRGMVGVKSNKLSSLIGMPPSEQGHVKIDVNIPISTMGWWSERKNVALIYASTDGIHGKKAGYDVVLRGTVNVEPGPGGNVAHKLRDDMNTIVNVTDVYYALPNNDRKGTLINLIGS